MIVKGETIMVETKTDKKTVILETIEAYADPTNRAMYPHNAGENEGTCQYRTLEGKMCAVGRCMTEDALEEYGKCSRSIDGLAFGAGGVDNLLREEYHGHSVEFWSRLQELHDTDYFWSDEGITQKGIVYIRENFNISIV